MRRSTGALTPCAAADALARFILGENGTKTVAEVIGRYAQDRELSAARRATAIRLIQKLGATPVSQLTTSQLTAYGEKFRLSAGTLRKEIGLLVTAINYAVKTKLISADDKPYLERPAEPPPRDRVLSREEAVRLGKAMKDEGEACFVYYCILLKTAARRDSVLHLTWDRVDFARRAINFAAPGDTPGSRKRRGWVPMSSQLEKVLLAYGTSTGVIAEDQSGAMRHFTGSSRVFPASPRWAFERACKAAGMEDVTPHVLRHTWATWAAQDGVSMVDIAGVLHDSVRTVEKRYVHLSPQHLRKAVER